MNLDPDPRVRFESKYIPVTESGCWIWTGSTKQYGYGKFWVHTRGELALAHRFSYELYRGPIPSGLTLDHLCRVRCCVNPDHLEAVDNKTNVLRGIGLSAVHAKKTHCIRGHEFTPENIGKMPRPEWRVCKACARSRPKRKIDTAKKALYNKRYRDNQRQLMKGENYVHEKRDEERQQVHVAQCPCEHAPARQGPLYA